MIKDRQKTRSLVLVLSLVVLGAATLFQNVEPAYACDPLPPPPPSEALNEATAVFSGEVIDLVETGTEPPDQYYDVHFAVQRIWKGVTSSEVIVETHQETATCGYPFEIGRTYLVYAHGEEDELNTGIHLRTTLWENASEDLEELGEGDPVEQVAPETPAGNEDTGTTFWLFLAMLLLVSGLVAVVIVVRRARAAGVEEEDVFG